MDAPARREWNAWLLADLADDVVGVPSCCQRCDVDVDPHAAWLFTLEVGGTIFGRVLCDDCTALRWSGAGRHVDDDARPEARAWSALRLVDE